MIGIIANYLGAQKQGDNAAGTGEETTDGRSPRPTLVTDDELVDRLVAKLSEGEVSDDQLIALRTYLVGDRSPSMEVKLDHLRTKVADLEAYSDALEEFIDGEGTARFLLEELRDELRATDAGLEELTARVRSIEDDQTSVREELSGLEDDHGSLDDYVHTLEGRHSRELVGVDAKVERVEQAVEATLDAVQNDVEGLDRRVTAVESLEVEVRELRRLEETVSAMRSELGNLRSVPDEVAALADQVDSLEAVRGEIRAVHQLRDQVSAVEAAAEEYAGVQDRVVELETFRATFVEAVSAPTGAR